MSDICFIAMHSCRFLVYRRFRFFRFSLLVTGFPLTSTVRSSVRSCILLLPLVTYQSSLFYPRSPSYWLVSVPYCGITKMSCITGIPFCKYHFKFFHVSSKIQNHATTQVIFLCSSMGFCLCSVPFHLDCNLMGQVLYLVHYFVPTTPRVVR